MRINHNITALNTYNKLSSNNSATQKSLEKLSSGLRINKAGDDAAGLAISEKMRGQIRGLDMASKNSSDGISMISTAEGALSETHSILQRMKELATQASNGTNTDADRAEIQKEVNQLSSEINRIGNTTEFNTQSLLKGDGKVNLAKTGLVTDGKLAGGQATQYTQATQTTTIGTKGVDTDTITFQLQGINLAITLSANTGSETNYATRNSTGTSATLVIDSTAASNTTTNEAGGIRTALQEMIDKNEVLKGQYTVSGTGDDIKLTAVAGGAFQGAAGSIGAYAKTGTIAASAGTGTVATGTTTAAIAAYKEYSLAAATTANLEGKGMTINDQQIEFYNAEKGAYTGSAIGVDVSKCTAASDIVNTIVTQVGNKLNGVTLSAGTASTDLKITATNAGTSGNEIAVSDGGIQKNFKTTFQVGANQGQSFAIEFSDMRSKALGITGTTAGGTAANNAVFTKVLDVTNGTDDTNVEYALDVSTTTNASNAIKVLDNAITTVSAERSKMGAYQNRLEHTINNLGTTSENLTAAESRIRDVDMAKEMMEFTKNNILSQAAQSMLAQANQQPQKVLQLLQ